MATSHLKTEGPVRPRRRRWGLVLLIPAASVIGLSWWLTAPLEDDAPPDDAAAGLRSIPATPTPGPPEATADRLPPWPEGRLDGRPAKALLLATLLEVDARLDHVHGYTATLRKQERLRGVLGPEQTLAMKVRHRPFAIYLKFLAPTEGKEVVYAEGHHDNKVIAHSTGVSRWLVPRLAVPPDHPLALAETRHAVTEAGLAKLTDKLLGFRQMDLDDSAAETILDRIVDDQGRPWLRSIHTHAHYASDRPFCRVEVLYDPETRYPLRISSYDWPAPDHEGDLLLAERYQYDDLDFEAPLSALDFDPANPAYAFHRY